MGLLRYRYGFMFSFMFCGQTQGPSVKHKQQTEEPSMKHKQQTEEPIEKPEQQTKKELEHDDTHQLQLPAPLVAPLCTDDVELTLSETEAIWQAILRLHDVSRVRFRRLDASPSLQPLLKCAKHGPGSLCNSGGAEPVGDAMRRARSS